jgi:hypothetical protein
MKMRQPMKEEILQILSAKYNIPRNVLDMIVDSPFYFLRNNVMSTGQLKAMRMTNWGVYKISPKKVEWILKHKERNDNKRVEEAGE